MRTIRISDEVWEAIARQGKFGETEDDVLRRVFGIKGEHEMHSTAPQPTGPRRRFATRRMHAGVHRAAGAQREHLLVSFEGSPEKRWELPDRSEKGEIRRVRQEAIEYALDNGASKPGQTNYVLKALTDASYYLTK